MKFYEVGGYVRDDILGLPSKDIDFTVVLDANDIANDRTTISGAPFAVMLNNLEAMGFKVFEVKPEFLTVRARFPRKGDEVAMPESLKAFGETGTLRVSQFDKYKGMTADFVLARKEADYTDGRRPDSVIPGSLEDDLARRDFTMNAIARDSSGELIDPHFGAADINLRLVRAVGDPRTRLLEDALRAVRALRFTITKGFTLEGELEKVLRWDNDVLDAVAFKVHDDRKRIELNTMLAFDTLKTLNTFSKYPALTGAIFSTGNLSLEATLKKRKK